MAAGGEGKSASHWLEGNVNHRECQIRHCTFVNDVTAAQWQCFFPASHHGKVRAWFNLKVLSTSTALYIVSLSGIWQQLCSAAKECRSWQRPEHLTALHTHRGKHTHARTSIFFEDTLWHSASSMAPLHNLNHQLNAKSKLKLRTSVTVLHLQVHTHIWTHSNETILPKKLICFLFSLIHDVEYVSVFVITCFMHATNSSKPGSSSSLMTFLASQNKFESLRSLFWVTDWQYWSLHNSHAVPLTASRRWVQKYFSCNAVRRQQWFSPFHR